jgi:hypothetical protein
LVDAGEEECVMVAAKKRRVTGPTESEQLAARLAVVEAERAALYDALKAVMVGIPDTEQTKNETQIARRVARSLLADMGKVTP